LSENKSKSKIDYKVNRAWFKVLFNHAIRTHESEILCSIKCFRTGNNLGGLLTDHEVRTLITDQDERDKEDADFINKMAGIIYTHRLSILICSPFPYAEHLITDIIVDSLDAGNRVSRLSDGGRWLGDNIYPSLDKNTLLVISFYEGDPAKEKSDFVQKIINKGNPVIMGCANKRDVPGGFKELVDIEITLPKMSSLMFEEVLYELFSRDEATEDSDGSGEFGKVFGNVFYEVFHKKRLSEHTINAIHPTDLQQPVRLGYTQEETLTYIEERVSKRFNVVNDDSVPSIDDLYGLGEASIVARDLVNDIDMAISNRIDWSEVDRGMLMVGPPGTGKTTLARAIARDCGIRFIEASVSKWMVGDTLGPHLAAIRSSFEEARRYQPSILFIDEMDSIGNREMLGPRGRSYYTAVINCLLEELDGFTGRDKIIIIAATNYEDNIDPALRRSGRLDQIVKIPYPNAAALREIIRFHLKSYEEGSHIDGDIDYEYLGKMAFGLTGADIEFIVRGAARRARRADRKIEQSDLIAELMSKPRDEMLHEPLGEDTMRRLAVHEAGHALVRLLSDTRGAEIAYASIGRRSDGQAGYTAVLEEERTSYFSTDYEHQASICLAGRAAESVVYGAENISDLAGNGDESSDLAKASSLIKKMIGLVGLSDEQNLVWYEDVSDKLKTDLNDKLDSKLRVIYADLIVFMKKHRELLDSIVDILIEKQEVSGDELRKMVSR